MAAISRRGFLRAARNLLVGGILSAAGLFKYVELETTWFKLNRYQVVIPKLPDSFDGLKAVHLSDFHFGDPITPKRFSKVVELVNQQSADLILITGDFIDRDTDHSQIPEYVFQLSALESRSGVYAVLGNHDHWEDASLVRSMMKDSGITELCNRTTSIRLGGDQLYLCGLDSYMEGLEDLDAVLAGLPDGETGILLVHEPDYADISAKTGRFSLQLSGHSHGGQVVIPMMGPPVTPPHGEKYPRGMYTVGEMQLYTNRGIGMVRPYVRFNCRPEVAVFTLSAGN